MDGGLLKTSQNDQEQRYISHDITMFINEYYNNSLNQVCHLIGSMILRITLIY